MYQADLTEPQWQYIKKVLHIQERKRKHDLREFVRFKCGQKKQVSIGISIRWGNNCSLKGIGGNKKIKGIKRHVIVDKNGFLISVIVTIANIHDSKAAYLLILIAKELCPSVKVVLTDGGYRG